MVNGKSRLPLILLRSFLLLAPHVDLGVVASLLDDHFDGRALEAVGLPQAVLDVPLIGEVEQLRHVAE